MYHTNDLGNHVLYWGFENLDNVVLMEGNKQADINDVIIPGKVRNYI